MSVAWDLTTAEGDGTDRYVLLGLHLIEGQVSFSLNGGVTDGAAGGGLSAEKKQVDLSGDQWIDPTLLSVPSAGDDPMVALRKAVLTYLNAQGEIGAGSLSVAL